VSLRLTIRCRRDGPDGPRPELKRWALMRDCAMNEYEVQARAELVSLAEAMLAGRESFLEGAVKVLALRSRIGGIGDHDPDFSAFVLISSETDSLPLEQFRHLWSQSALERLDPEIREANSWARPIAEPACSSLINRFAPNHSLQARRP